MKAPSVLCLALGVLVHGCAADGTSPSDEPVSGESHAISAPAWYAEPDLDGAAFPLAAHDPRGVLQLPEDAYFIDQDGLPLTPDGAGIDKDIVGGESRVAVNPTTSWPARTVTLLVHRFASDPANAFRICTGTLVGSDAVLTAAHCTWNGGQWASFMVAVPGGYPNPANPNQYLGPWGTSSGVRLFAHDDYRLGSGLSKTAHDIGMVRIGAKLGDSVGTRTPVAATNNINESILYYGYQGDLTRYQMYSSAGALTGWLNQSLRLLKTSADAFHGSSGAGAAKLGNSNQLFGLLVGGSGLTPANQYNVITAFDSARINKINSWTTAPL